MASRKQKTDAETWALLREGEAQDDLEEIAAMPPDEVQRELRDGGFDPEALRARGLAAVAKLRERHQRLGWQMGARAKAEKVQAIAREGAGRHAKLTRAELLARITAARSDPRLGGQLGAMFRKRKAEESSDDELRALLEELELLAKLEGEDEEPGE